MTSRYAEQPALPDGAPGEVHPVKDAAGETAAWTPPAGGLVQLGSAEGVVCEDGACWAPAKE